MVSSGQVSSDAQAVSQIISSYLQQISGLSGSWMGTSYDSIVSKAESFASDFGGTIENQMSSFAEAVSLYEQYEYTKNNLEITKRNYNTAVSNKDGSNANAFANQINDYQRELANIKQQINQALASASSSRLEATPIKTTVDPASSDFINYYQYNYNQPYSTGTIGTDGCGPTSMAMVLTNLTGKEITPVEMAAKGNGRYTCSKGTYWSFFGDMAKEYGVNCQQMDVSQSNIVNNLNAGKTLILSMRAGHFTRSGHFIVVRGIDNNGQLIVSDPNSEERSNQRWPVSTVAGEACQIWALSA